MTLLLTFKIAKKKKKKVIKTAATVWVFTFEKLPCFMYPTPIILAIRPKSWQALSPLPSNHNLAMCFVNLSYKCTIKNVLWGSNNTVKHCIIDGKLYIHCKTSKELNLQAVLF